MLLRSIDIANVHEYVFVIVRITRRFQHELLDAPFRRTRKLQGGVKREFRRNP